MKRIYSLILFLVSLCSSWAANNVFSDELPFKGGEHAVYNIYYNLGFIWIHAGNVEFDAKERKVNQTELFDLKISGYTVRSFDHFYRIRDTFSVTTRKKDLAPLKYREVKYEDSYFCDKRYNFDWKNEDADADIYMQFNVRGKKSKDTLAIQKGILDLITTCYHFRSVDMSKIKKGQSIPFKMVFDKEIYDLALKYVGEETIKLRNKKKYKALKFQPQLITGDIFDDEDAMSVYVSNDQNHVPLYIEAKIKVGSVKVMLEDVKNTKTPMSSLVK